MTPQGVEHTYADGKTKDLHYKAGETTWVPGEKHAGENLSDQPIEFIVVIPKAGTKPAARR